MSFRRQFAQPHGTTTAPTTPHEAVTSGRYCDRYSVWCKQACSNSARSLASTPSRQSMFLAWADSPPRGLPIRCSTLAGWIVNLGKV